MKYPDIVAVRFIGLFNRASFLVETFTKNRFFTTLLDTIVASVQKTGRAAAVHQAVQFMGFGAEIGMEIQEKAFAYLDAPVVRIAAPNVPPSSSPVLESAFLPNERDIIASIKKLIR